MPWTFPYLGETEELNELTRAGAPGKFIRLSDGHTHYELSDSNHKGVVVLVHGFSVPSFIWDPTYKYLSKNDYQVLRYDIFGRGYSDRPIKRYDIDLFCKQLIELLDRLGLREIFLMGLSLGGPISATFTVRHPQRVRRLVLEDPAGAKSFSFPFKQQLLSLPGIGELAFGLLGNEKMIKGIASDLYGPDLVNDFQERFRVQLKFKGCKRALLSTIRNRMLGDFSEVYQRIGRLGIPTLLLWGREDRTIPFEHSIPLQKAIPQAELHAFDHCGHIPHYEKPEIVNKILDDFFQ